MTKEIIFLCDSCCEKMDETELTSVKNSDIDLISHLQLHTHNLYFHDRKMEHICHDCYDKYFSGYCVEYSEIALDPIFINRLSSLIQDRTY